MAQLTIFQKLDREHKIISMYIDNAKTYVQLSMAALVFSVAFLQSLVGKKDIVPLDLGMIFPWLSWLVAIISGVTYQYSSVKYLENIENKLDALFYRRKWRTHMPAVFIRTPYRIYGVMMTFFYIGVISFTMIAMSKMIGHFYLH
jgi:hypothetical protein